jgi:hypothetical protein
MLPRSVAAQSVRSAIQAGRTLWAALSLALALTVAPAAARAQSGTIDAPTRLDPVDNRAVVTFIMNNGVADSAIAGASVNVTRRAGLAINGPFAAPVAPGTRHAFAHQLTNRGTDADVVQLTGSVPALDHHLL